MVVFVVHASKVGERADEDADLLRVRGDCRGERERGKIGAPVPRMASHVVITLGCAADVAVAGESVRAWARDAGMRSTVAAELATCAAELASNIVRHGGGGTLAVDGDAARVCMRADDRGPGDPARVRALLAVARAQVGAPRRNDEHGLATVVRWMDVVEVEARPGGGLLVRATRERGGARGIGA